MIKDIESKAREMLWRLYAPMKQDKPEMVTLFEWYPRIYFEAILKKTMGGHCGQLYVRKMNYHEENVLDRTVWEDNAQIYFKCLDPSDLPSDQMANVFTNDVFYLTQTIRNMISKHEGTE